MDLLPDRRAGGPGPGWGFEVTAPTGIRRTRGQAGWKLPAGAVIVDRTSRRGNPFTIRSIVAEHQALGITLTDVDAAAIACRRYAEWLDGAGPARVQGV